MRPTKPALKIAALTACLLALFACTEEKNYITNVTNPAPDQRPPLVEWVSVGGLTTPPTPPSIEGGDFGHPPLTPPASGGGTASVVSDTVALTISATDESGIDSVKLYINGFARFRATLPAPPSIEGGVFAFSWNTLSDSDGVYSLEARAWDKAGNVGVSPALLLNVRNTTPPPPPDRTPPRIRILSPEPGSIIRNEFELEFVVIDSSLLDSILIFVDGEIGQILAAGDDSLYIAHMNSSRWSNGRRIIEVRAYDAAGNIGISNPLGLTIDNHRVIWVPDDFETIQGAINASVDGDTVRVRAGTYEEGVWFLGKNIWLDSESGAEATWIKGIGWNDGVRVEYDGDFGGTTIRGFRVTGSYNGIVTEENGSLYIFNCIVDQSLLPIDGVNGIINYGRYMFVANCIVTSADWGFVEGYSEGDLVNTVFVHCNTGYFADATFRTPQERHHNLFWDNNLDYEHGESDNTDVFDNPQFNENNFGLKPNSPAIDSGDPQILDRDGSRSDIGLYGGPYAYPPPNQ